MHINKLDKKNRRVDHGNRSQRLKKYFKNSIESQISFDPDIN